MSPIYKRLLGYIRRYFWLFILSVVANALYSAVDASLVKSLQPLIDNVFVAKDQGLVRLIPYLLPAAFLLRGIMSFTSDYGMAYISRRVIMTFRQELFAHLQVLPALFYDTNSTGQILAKLTYNVDQIAKASTDVIVDIVRNSFLICFLIGVMFWTSWRLTLCFMIICPVVGLLFNYANKRFRKISRQLQDSIGQLNHIAEENIESYKVVRTFNGQSYEIAQYNRAVEKNRRMEMKMIVTKSISQPLIQSVGGLGLAVTVVLATSSHSPENLTAGAFATLMTAMVSLLNPIKQLSSISNKIQQGLAGAESVFELLDLPPEVDKGRHTIKRAQGHIEFKKLDFTYPGRQERVLKQLSLTINPGEKVALVGRSGSGKSTLVSLLLRFYEGYSGAILLDQHDIREIMLPSLRDQFAIVSQHVSLFNDTIANNIAYGTANADREAIMTAARAAYAMEFIEQLPQGIDTLVGENGTLLSGGQRQRIAIARAIFKQAPILILDEATSALDTESEASIQMAINKLTAHKTTLIIAHRLSTIEHADKIVVLDRGEIVEVGTHQQLMSRQGHYANFHQTQIETPA